MTGVSEDFSSYKEEIKFQIQMWDKSKCNLDARGTILFQRENGKVIPIHDMLHVPGLGMKLISVSVLQDKGYNVVFGGA